MRDDKDKYIGATQEDIRDVKASLKKLIILGWMIFAVLTYIAASI